MTNKILLILGFFIYSIGINAQKFDNEIIQQETFGEISLKLKLVINGNKSFVISIFHKDSSDDSGFREEFYNLSNENNVVTNRVEEGIYRLLKKYRSYSDTTNADSSKTSEIASNFIFKGRAFMLDYFDDEAKKEWGLNGENFARIEDLEKEIYECSNNISQNNLFISSQKKYIKFQNRLSKLIVDSTLRSINTIKTKTPLSSVKITPKRTYKIMHIKPWMDWQKDTSIFNNLSSESLKILDSLKCKSYSDIVNMNLTERDIIDNRLHKLKAVEEINEIKDEFAQPIVFLSGSALSFLNKSLNNDSVQSSVQSIGIHATKADKWETNIDLTFSQTGDILSSTDPNVFGSSILIPGIRKLSFLSNFRWLGLSGLSPYSRNVILRKAGAGINFNITQLQWQYGKSDTIVKVIPVAFDAFLSYIWLRASRSRVNIGRTTQISTDFGLVFRGVFGDAAQNPETLNTFLNSNKLYYLGGMLGISIKIDKLTIFYNGTYIPTRFEPVPGLTGGQIISSLGIRADVVRFSNGNTFKRN